MANFNNLLSCANYNTGALHSQTFTANGALSFTVPTGTIASTTFKFICVGPGGGGGSNGGTTPGGGGGGGGSGAYAEYLVSGFTAGNVISGNVGGVGGAGSTSSGSSGGNGNAASKVTYASTDFITCGAGVGGSSGNGAGPFSGGAAGTVSNNFGGAGLTLVDTIANSNASAGATGDGPLTTIGSGGAGGSNPFGKGGTGPVAGTTAIAGQSGSGYGAGGGGGASSGAQSTGGSGTGGVVIIEWVL